MKIRGQGREAGSVLLTSIMTSGILGLILVTYLTMARSQHVSSVYSQSWHKSLTLAEAGVEEALAQMNGAGVSPDSSPKVTSFGPVHRDFDGSSSYDIQVVA